ncbi:Translation initiation factor IF-2 [Wickerhamomyces ciferrii]|uniref:Translation initiation factor IF-2 n=1 Tax=Wickerhamomyces ciferrii (strain ATCC 14091 / BCRC 22168 / CBS 111 / JCM 3599 / NBRC 0793 / NRRL Y-1031 F-60-10) TaxID=1206466 RepID=K0KAI8_WICCF|nr:Translation initiation factor IF-2 [Wickerhamomyces ciferrii]CCH41995.1 Translation initiation factor IF-2 [Wickerhamomyces ciferrii]
MSGLASKWADEPDLVKAAVEQDSTKRTSPSKSINSTSPSKSNAVTSVKGKPLASKWADSSDDEKEEEVKIPIHKSPPKHKSIPKEPRKYRDSPKKHNKVNDLSSIFDNQLQLEDHEDSNGREQMTPEAKAFASRLGISSNDQPSKPKIQFNKHHKSKHQHDEEHWEDDEEEDQEDEYEIDEEEYKPQAPTKAGNSLASRLGLGSTLPEKPIQPSKEDIRNRREQERDRLQKERTKANREWNHNKDFNRNRGHNDRRYSNHNRDHNDNRYSHQNRDHKFEHRGQHHQDHHKEYSLRGNKYDNDREHRVNQQSNPEPKPQLKAEKLTKEQLAKQEEELKQLEEMMSSGGKNINWADFEDGF